MSDAALSPPPPVRRQPLLVRLWPVWLILAGLIAAWRFGLFELLSLDTLRDRREALTGYVAAHPLAAIGLYLGVYILATVFMLPGALWITISGGFLFGLAGGSLLTLLGATGGASLLFLLAKSALGSALQRRAGPFLARMEKGFREDQLAYMFAMRFAPVMPFPVANIAPALLGAKYLPFALTTALGIIPGVIAYTWIGAGLGATFDAGRDPDLGAVAANLLPAGIALGLVSLLPVAWKRFFARRKAS